MGNMAINKGEVCNFCDASQTQKKDLYKVFYSLKNDNTLLLLACFEAIR